MRQPVGDREVAALLKTFPDKSFAKRFVRTTSRMTDAPLRFLLQASLYVVDAYAPIPKQSFFGTDVRANPFTWLVGDSGRTRKSTVINLARSVIVGGGDGDRLIDTPGSSEGLLRVLQEDGTRTMLVSEGQKFLTDTQPKNYKASLRPILMDLYDRGEASHQVRDKKKSMTATNIKLSFLGACTPVHVTNYLDGVDASGGYFNRHFWTYANPSSREIDQGAARRVQEDEFHRLEDHFNLRMESYSQFPSQAYSEICGRGLQRQEEWNQKAAAWIGALPTVEHVLFQRYRTKMMQIIMLLGADWELDQHEDWVVPDALMRAAVRMSSWDLMDTQRMAGFLAARGYELDRRLLLNCIDHLEQTRGKTIFSYAEISQHIRPRMHRAKLEKLIDSVVMEGSLYLLNGSEYSQYPPAVDKDEYPELDLG